jgi:hypothetical protein
MRLQRAVPTLAAAVALAASAAPAYAFDNRAPELGPVLGSHSSSTDSSDTAIEIGAGLVAAAAIGVGGYAAGRRSVRVGARTGTVVAGRS